MDVESAENENPTTVAEPDVVESAENDIPITMAEPDVIESAENENPTTDVLESAENENPITMAEPDVGESAENENPATVAEPDVVESAENENPITMAEPDVVESVENENPITKMEPDVVESAENEKTTIMVEPDVVESAESENPTTMTEPNVVESTCKAEPLGSEDLSTDSVSEDEQNPEIPENSDKKLDNEEYPDQEPSPKKQKFLSPNVDPSSELQLAKTPAFGSNNGGKKSSKKKSKGNNVWTKSSSRKGKKKAKSNTSSTPKAEDTVFIAPVPRFPDKNDDSPDANICLSKVYKAEKVELSDDRMSAGSCKGYRMVRTTRGVTEGAWYFEIKVVHMGESGHTRLGWSTEKGDLQAPVGYDANSFGYRDMDGSKIHKALRQKYGDEGYKEGDVIGFYINLPNGSSYTPKPPHLVWYKGQKYVCAPDPKEDPPKIIPGSEISFFKNGICQGVAFKDLYGGCYYPAASMYTLPYQPNCVVKFNFGPNFECFPADLGERPVPRPMIEVPYHGLDNRVENDVDEKQQ